MNARKQSRAEEKAELAAATAALDSRKAVTKKPKLYKELREKATAKPKSKKEKPKKAAKKRRLDANQGAKSTDALAPYRRAKGSGWAGKRQK